MFRSGTFVRAREHLDDTISNLVVYRDWYRRHIGGSCGEVIGTLRIRMMVC